MSNLNENIQDAAHKLNLNLDWLRQISPEEILYLVDQCPFLQIVCADDDFPGQAAEILTANTGWKIHFYGDAMSSSPGEEIFNTEIHGKGTIAKRAWDTAIHMLEIAKDHGWKTVNIVDGHPLMMRAIWLAAETMGITLVGYEPSKLDWQIRGRLALSSNDLEVLIKQIHTNSPAA